MDFVPFALNETKRSIIYFKGAFFWTTYNKDFKGFSFKFQLAL